MDIFESLENLEVSEACFNDLMNIVEEIINELKDTTIAKVYNKRYGQYKDASLAARDNMSDLNLNNYYKTSDKLEKNINLGLKRDKKLGKNVYDKNLSFNNRNSLTREAQKDYHDKVKEYKRVASDASPWGGKHYGISDVENAESEARQAKKKYHDTMDAYNTVKRDKDYLKKHLEYQKTHDSKGNRR
jgi:hypothetical protein